jgi:esterase/lipase superfamily enzyme
MTARQPIDFSRIRAAIADAIRDEERTSRLKEALRQASGAATGDAAIAAQVERIRNAITVVPNRLAATAALDTQPKVWQRVRRVLLDIVACWDQRSHIIPDNAGLLGRIDDALISHLLLARIYRWRVEEEGVESSALAGQFDLDLRRALAPGLDDLIAKVADDIWERGFKVTRLMLPTWTSIIFEVPKVAAPKPVRGVEPPARLESSEPAAFDSGPRLYEIWFGTNRTPLDPRDPSKGFGGTRDDRVHYGVCEVAIPKAHKFGSVGTAWWRRWLRLEFADDHIQVARRRKIDDAATFFDELREELASSQGNQLLFYLHGFNVSFDEAAIRAAQLFADLKVPGAAAFFSWPSKASVDDYFADVERIGDSEANIAAFLTGLATQLGGATVHIIAHSMGNRGLARAIQRIAAAVEGTANVHFGQIILAAPDISVELFNDLARIYPTLCARTTMYVSARDRALGLSKWLQDGPRAGFTPPVTIVPNIDTVEVTNIDLTLLGHGYYAEAEAVLYDIAALLQHNSAPAVRPRLSAGRVSGSDSGYWVIGA